MINVKLTKMCNSLTFNRIKSNDQTCKVLILIFYYLECKCLQMKHA